MLPVLQFLTDRAGEEGVFQHVRIKQEMGGEKITGGGGEVPDIGVLATDPSLSFLTGTHHDGCLLMELLAQTSLQHFLEARLDVLSGEGVGRGKVE